MSKSVKGQATPPKVQDEALKIALGIQKSGQTKEQTKLIAQGIQKGIELYKKQQNAAARELDKKRKQALKRVGQETEKTASSSQMVSVVKHKQHGWPWVLLVLTWLGVGAYLIINNMR